MRYGFLGGMEGLPASGYGISKLALNGLSIKMARELMDEGIAVNCVCPDITDSYGYGFGRAARESAKGVAWVATMGLGNEILQSSLGLTQTRVSSKDLQKFIATSSHHANLVHTPSNLSQSPILESKNLQNFIPKVTQPLMDTQSIIETKTIDLQITGIPQNLKSLSGKFYRDSIEIQW